MRCINGFKKVVVEIGRSNDVLKQWIFEKGLRINYMLCDKLRLEE